MNRKKVIVISIIITLFAVSISLIYVENKNKVTTQQEFNSKRAYQDIVAQENFGARIPGSDAHQKTIDYIKQILQQNGWNVELQETTQLNQSVTNIIAKKGSLGEWILLGAHYDSRFFADQDPKPENRNQPVPGANDGASGVAVLLELARILPQMDEKQIWLVFYDAEDQGKVSGWDWILGSQTFAQELTDYPDAVINIDMIGDADLNIYQEKFSDPMLTQQIWDTAAELGYQQYFIPEYKYAILDDHLPFVNLGIPAIDIIDFDYPYWHTLSDTSDKVSPDSLQIVGETLLKWLVPVE
jgi:Zn-dependent M28 family amino/carboxypeptidase